jgi:NhaA family Na+:H+ antiporter
MSDNFQDSSISGLIRRYVSASALLIGATVLALFFANWSVTRELYSNLWELPVALSIGGFNVFSHGGHPMSLLDFINDFLMFYFFLSVGLEIKREICAANSAVGRKPCCQSSEPAAECSSP